jgi:hypothetical protein
MGALKYFSDSAIQTTLHTKHVIDTLGKVKRLPELQFTPSAQTRLSALAELIREAQKHYDTLPSFYDEEVLVVCNLAVDKALLNPAAHALQVQLLLKELRVVTSEHRSEVYVHRKADYSTYEKYPEWSSIYVQSRIGCKRLIEENMHQLLEWGRKPYQLIG